MKPQFNKNLFITPHIGGTALEAQEKAYKHVITKIRSSKLGVFSYCVIYS